MKKTSLLLPVFVLLIFVFTCCDKKSPTEVDSKTMTDIDGNRYQTVKIGNQVWMAENLKVTHYRDGTPINHATDDPQWISLLTGAYCAYDNSKSTADIYGYLYNWYAVNDSRNIAPAGWRVPTDDDWKELEMSLGMSSAHADSTSWRGSPVGSMLAGNADLWGFSHLSGALKNHAEFSTSGFSALPAGYRYRSGFSHLGSFAYFWSATESATLNAWSRHLYYNNSAVYRSNGFNKRRGFSVRLIRD